MESAVFVENLGKRFNRYHAKKPTTLMEAALSGLRQVKPIEDFWALKGVSFEVAVGEMVGVIGHNGAGKSTLLQLLGKVAHPTEGKLTMRGRVGALLDLSAGFHGDLTGRENVFVTAIVAGLPRCEVARRFDRIVEFAELEGFIDNPVRTYSTGMMMRLAFSVAVHTDPNILLVDEFLSVGDISFQTKCLTRITQMKAQGCAIVLVSHDIDQVKRLCDRALWLKKGTVRAYGEPNAVTDQYATDMMAKTQRITPNLPETTTRSGIPLRTNDNRFGSLKVEIVDVRALPSDLLTTGDPLCIEIDYKNEHRVDSANFSLSIHGLDGQKYLDVTTSDLTHTVVLLERSGTLRLLIDRLDIAAGDYFIDVGIYEKEWSYAYDSHSQAYPISVQSRYVSQGILVPPMRWESVSSLSEQPQRLL
ncbi:ABC transporter, ATP-binding protein [Synechococcus sp. PCC 7335]|uniref:ABC transporter ATP-binding protein n=1 Tax=Synechococcus sp. (strain ATCC 29403 / PCC 7335) TaxID=91464 RepID=UPI00017ED1C2|nr:ABC transporter ATP-binding protein [Synechococcus sp. PCC 7335]EDX87713.1 ABC transporter, ATP-binding protein [Synechococcus sp. PCC 7335]